jgi:hypothetical protein
MATQRGDVYWGGSVREFLVQGALRHRRAVAPRGYAWVLRLCQGRRKVLIGLGALQGSGRIRFLAPRSQLFLS